MLLVEQAFDNEIDEVFRPCARDGGDSIDAFVCAVY